MSSDCPFCELDGREILAEDDYVRVFLSNPRQMLGHTLVVPKRHVEKPWELTDAETMAVNGQIKLFQPILAREFGAGCDVRQNYRPYMAEGQVKVAHVHYHILPRVENDELYQRSESAGRELFTPLSQSESAQVIARIKAVLQ